MGFFNKNKKEIPADLPDLTFDKQEPQESKPITKALPLISSKPEYEKIQIKTENKPNLDEDSDEKGFFKDLINNLVQEQKNVEKMESFYNNKFATEDLVYQMRNYWEDQKPELMLKNVGADLKVKMNEKSEALHKLEKEWQDIYFALLSKEDQIRAEEKELKDLINEFISVCKKTIGKKRSK